MEILSSGLTDIGLKRRGNEDSFVCDKALGLYAVADGMGGHAAGEVASRTAVLALADAIAQASAPASDAASLRTGVEEANRRIREIAAAQPAYCGMGTTLSALAIRDEKGALAHVGDSRIYRLRQGLLERLTSDHSWVGEQLRYGLLTPDQARDHPMRNVITRALGSRERVEVDTLEFDVLPGDRYLLCSDGLWGLVRDEELAQALGAMDTDLEAVCEALRELAYRAGANDNITLIILRVMEQRKECGND